jgi:hypothetical protein
MKNVCTSGFLFPTISCVYCLFWKKGSLTPQNNTPQELYQMIAWSVYIQHAGASQKPYNVSDSNYFYQICRFSFVDH